MKRAHTKRRAAQRPCYRNELAELRRRLANIARVETDPVLLSRCRAMGHIVAEFEVLLDLDRPGEARAFVQQFHAIAGLLAALWGPGAGKPH